MTDTPETRRPFGTTHYVGKFPVPTPTDSDTFDKLSANIQLFADRLQGALDALIDARPRREYYKSEALFKEAWREYWQAAASLEETCRKAALTVTIMARVRQPHPVEDDC